MKITKGRVTGGFETRPYLVMFVVIVVFLL